MSDNLKRHYALEKSLKQLRPCEPKGHVARHIKTLALFIGGIIGSKKTHLPAVASHITDSTLPQSRVRRLERWVHNEGIDTKTYFLPYVDMLLRSLPHPTLALVIDGSDVGRGCVALSVNVLYQRRALPLCWIVVAGKKGHLPEETHIQLLQEVALLLPKGRPVVFLGDGEFDGCDLQKTIQGLGWHYVLRTAKNVRLCDTSDGTTPETVSEESEWFSPTDLHLQPGNCHELSDVLFTQQAYGPVLVAIVWEPTEERPLVLVTNFDFWHEAYRWYKKRFYIETFFSDQKSRGFYLAHSHISDPKHLHRLLIVTCLAYIWLVCLGAFVVCQGYLARIHRSNRCDWSLFHIGMNWLQHCLNQQIDIWVDFKVPKYNDALNYTQKSVG